MPHLHEKVDFTSEVLVVYQDTVLLRLHDKFNIWLSVGGHIELDEDPNQAAVREVKEEVGLDVQLYSGNQLRLQHAPNYKELIPPVFLNRHRVSPSHEHVTLTYFARSNTNVVVQGEKEKSAHIRWFTREELMDPKYNVEPRIQEYSRWALAVLGTPRVSSK